MKYFLSLESILSPVGRAVVSHGGSREGGRVAEVDGVSGLWFWRVGAMRVNWNRGLFDQEDGEASRSGRGRSKMRLRSILNGVR
jgi:hypothetical protein